MERLIGTIRREFLDQTLFWNSVDLEKKLAKFGDYCDQHRVHSSLDSQTPDELSGERVIDQAVLHHFRWQTHCRGLDELPVAA